MLWWWWENRVCRLPGLAKASKLGTGGPPTMPYGLPRLMENAERRWSAWPSLTGCLPWVSMPPPPMTENPPPGPALGFQESLRVGHHGMPVSLASSSRGAGALCRRKDQAPQTSEWQEASSMIPAIVILAIVLSICSCHLAFAGSLRVPVLSSVECSPPPTLPHLGTFYKDTKILTYRCSLLPPIPAGLQMTAEHKQEAGQGMAGQRGCANAQGWGQLGTWLEQPSVG